MGAILVFIKNRGVQLHPLHPSYGSLFFHSLTEKEVLRFSRRILKIWWKRHLELQNVIILTKFHSDRAQIVDLLFEAIAWSWTLFYRTPSNFYLMTKKADNPFSYMCLQLDIFVTLMKINCKEKYYIHLDIT